MQPGDDLPPPINELAYLRVDQLDDDSASSVILQTRELVRKGQVGVADLLPLLRNRLPSVRYLAAWTVGDACATDADDLREVVKALLSMEEDNDERVLGRVAHSLGELRSYRPFCGDLAESALNCLVRLASHSSRHVRLGVARGLHGMNESMAFSALIQLSCDEDAEVRDWSTLALGESENCSAEVREALASRIEDPHYDTRCEAINGLVRLRDDRAVEALIRELRSDCVGTLLVEAARDCADARLVEPLVDLFEWWDVDDNLLRDAIARCRGLRNDIDEPSCEL